MKTRTGLLFLLCLFFSNSIFSQFTLVGDTGLCAGDCGIYQALENGQPILEDLFWDMGDGSTAVGPSITHCYAQEGVYIITVSDLNGIIVGELFVEVGSGAVPEIISLSGGFCATDSLSNCDRVCENTSVTYTTEVSNPGMVITWSVSGAESWVDNGNEVTVDWGDPGQGQVSVEVADAGSGDWFLSCGQFQNATLGGVAGIGFVYIDGPSGIYEILILNGMSLSGNGGQETIIGQLSPGTYTVWVTDQFGNIQTCDFIIEEYDLPCVNFGVGLDVTPPSDCNSCDGTIEPIFIGNSSPPYAFQWTGPNGFFSTDYLLTGVCPGQYNLMVYDGNTQCPSSTYVIVTCNSTSCSGSNSLCVDILEIPEAAFETLPPAINGVVEICEGQTVYFDNQTNGGFNYTWNFGNGVSSSQVDAEYTYLSAGTYEAILIARNDCFCGDTASVTIIVEEAITPEIDCAGTICPGEQVTYTSNADCSIFNWNVSLNGTIISGGGTSDDFITVDWGAGPEGIIELSVDGCNGDYCLQTLFENIPIIDDNAEIEGPSRVCKGAEVIYSMPAFAGTEFIWTVTSFGTITEGQGTNEITIQWANEVTPIQQQISVTYESCYLGCGGSDILLVNILNEVFIEGPIEACPDQMVTYTCRTPLGSLAQADWTVYDNVGAVVATSASPTPNYDVDWAFGSGTFIVHAEVQNPSNYCIDNFSIFVDVAPPTAVPVAITGSLDICPGTTYTYSGNSGPGSFDYTWYVSDGGANYILNGKTVNIIWGASAPYNLALTQTNLEGFACESASTNISPISINSVALSGTQFVCNEEIGIYTATDFDNLDYQWQITPSDAGSIIEGENTNQVEVQWHTAGTHDIQVTVCGVSDTYSVTVYPRPVPVPVYNTVCPGQTGAVVLTLPYVAYDWRNENGITISNSATPNFGTGYYEVIVTDNNGCTENETFYVGTFGQPDVTISTPDFGDFCQNGGSMTLYALETSSGPLDYQWYWNGTSFGTNSSSQVISQEGSYYVLVSDQNGCTDFSNTLTLNCASLPGGGSGPGCTPDGFPGFDIVPGIFCNESQYTNTSVNDVPNTWAWEFWDIVGGGITTSSLENPMNTWTNAGFNLVILQVGINAVVPGQVCTMSTYSFDTIPLVANFIHAGICGGEPVSFTDISTYIPQTSISSWSWDFDDPASGANNTSNLQNPSHIFNTGDFYTITLTTTDQSGCISLKQKTIIILDPPLTSFTIPAASCEGASLFFEANGTFTDINWDFGDPASGAANVSNIGETYHVYTNPGIYTVSLSVENVFGCTETVTQQVNIEANALTGIIDVNPATEVCAGDSVILTAPPADVYAWSTGAITQGVTVFDAGIYEVTIYDPVGCGYTPPSVTIDLIPVPQGQITAVEYNEYDQPTDYFYNNYETCFGDNVYMEITDNPNYTYQWSTGETSTDISFTEEKDNLLAVGTHLFTVTITDSNSGCTNVVGPFTVTVHPVPENILITSMPAAPVCENTPTVISVFNPEPTFIYIWNTGEVGTSINTFYAGKYFVRAINQFGCEGESNTLEIVPGPNVDLIPSGCHTRCNPDTICLPPVFGVASFQWYFNGSPIPPPEGNDPDLVATQSGEYYVEMVSVDGCVTISDILTLDLYDGFGSVQGNVYFDLNNNGIIDAADTLMMGIGIILQNGGINLDTLISNQIGSFSFSNILSTDYELIVDELNLPPGMIAVISQANANLVGCDDDEIVEFLIQYICTDMTLSLSLGACPGETVNYNGTDLSIGETQTFAFTTPIGCDSSVTVTVGPLNESINAISLQACTGTTINYNGTALSGGTVTDFIFDNSVGCDSVVTVTVVESDQDSSAIQLQACIGSSIDYNGTNLDPGTQTDFMFTSVGGCDSIITVIVNSLQNYTITENLEACTGETVSYNGSNLLPGTSTDFNFTTVDNCDSTVTVVVAELTGSTESLQLQACENSSVIYDGTELFPGSTTDFTFTNANNCDSVITVFVQSLLTSTEIIGLEVCQDETIIYDGIPLAAGSSTDFVFTNTAGCDSMITVQVAELPLYSFDLPLSACEGQTVEYNGDDLAAGSVTQYVFSSVDGCDSTVTVIVQTLSESSLILNVSACDGETYPFNGSNLPGGSSTDFVFTNAGGCDSTITVNVGALNITATFIDLFVCPGETIAYNGSELGEGFEDIIILNDQNGCDSTVTISVTAYPDFDYEVIIDPACWNDNNGTIVIENLVGGTGPFQFSIDGSNYQDSISFGNLSEGTFMVSVIDDNDCEVAIETVVNEIPPLEIIANDPEVPCDFSPVRLELENIADNAGSISYVWENGSVQSFITVDTPGVFAVEISNACEILQAQYTVSLAADARVNYFYVPNLFSPNDDGINDVWQIMPPDDMEVLSFELHVFDRWGNHMKTFATVYDFWDGSFKGKALDPGVYVWWYQATVLSCGRALEVSDKGGVTVVR
ncbi:MAG: gliding motility-associated-like protein [Saprospiraceae bacterium]|jgi:gliding motility-associated-like protein